MLNLLKLIFRTGTATEALDKYDYFGSDYKKINIPKQNTACEGCSICASGCPTGALYRTDTNELALDYLKCAFCARCMDLCPQRLLSKGVLDVPVVVHGEAIDYAEKVIKTFGRSLHVRHLDAGSCNACDFEMSALLSPVYDIQRFGVDFVASPRHADIVMVTGMVTRNLLQAVQETYDSMAKPALVMAVGTCACSGNMFGEKNYAQIGAVDSVLPVDIYVPGCPPNPKMMSYALLYAQELLAEKLK